MVDVAPATAAFDQGAFREVLGHFPTGVVLVTGIAADGDPVGMIVGSFASVSLEPPIVTFLPTRTSSTFERLRTASTFCINVLAADQTDICRTFARKGKDNKFEGLKWTPSQSGAPILDGVVASIDCTPDSIIEAGDHFIVLGAVEDLRVHNPTMPLLFFQGGYGRFTTHSLVAETEVGLIEAARGAEIARAEIERLAETLDVECEIMARSGADVVVVAVATRSNGEPATKLGRHSPLMPPLGELFVAESGQSDIEAWLRQRTSVDTVDEEQYRARLDATKARGWSMALAGPYRDSEFGEAIREYGHGDLTPSQHRRLASIVSQVSNDHEETKIVDGQTYDIAGIVAPIYDANGSVTMVLRISHLPAAAPATVVRGWVAAVVASAGIISTELANR